MIANIRSINMINDGDARIGLSYYHVAGNIAVSVKSPGNSGSASDLFRHPSIPVFIESWDRASGSVHGFV